MDVQVRSARIARIAAPRDLIARAHRIADAHEHRAALEMRENHVSARRFDRDVVAERARAIRSAFARRRVLLPVFHVDDHPVTRGEDRLIPRLAAVAYEIVREVLIADDLMVVVKRIGTNRRSKSTSAKNPSSVATHRYVSGPNHMPPNANVHATSVMIAFLGGIRITTRIAARVDPARA